MSVRGDLLVFSIPGCQKKFLGCGLLEGISNEADTMLRYSAATRKRNFMEQIRTAIFMESFSDKNNVKGPIQFRRERQPQHLKRWFFLKSRAIHFHINTTSVIRTVKLNQHWNKQATSCLNPQNCVDPIRV